ncbi:AraC family transcriptional regulator [Phycisphaerales bacterium AB-hyl4]|uniref:AraC family transcriptional regulator n=1 Tax=Natronomicrosphaera hydrolytica TaxID=3242702 RepID=A0ABV4U7H6_9BACT
MASKSTYTIGQQAVHLNRHMPVRAVMMAVDRDVAMHDHEFHEIGIVRSGEAIHRTAGGTRRISRGDAIVVCPGDAHGFSQHRNLKISNIYYLGAWLMADVRNFWDAAGVVPLFVRRWLAAQPIGDVAVARLLPDELQWCEHELSQLHAAEDDDHASLLYARACLTKVLVLVARAHARSVPGVQTMSFRNEVRVMVEHIERMVEQGGVLHIGKLSRAAGVTPDHSSRLFRQSLGVSPMQYFQLRRVQQTAVHLMDPGVSITQVAMRMGFTDASHLWRSFRRHMSVSPRQYRRRFIAAPK